MGTKSDLDMPVLEGRFRKMIGPLARKMEWDVYQAALFASDLLEDVNWHSLAGEIRQRIREDIAQSSGDPLTGGKRRHGGRGVGKRVAELNKLLK